MYTQNYPLQSSHFPHTVSEKLFLSDSWVWIEIVTEWRLWVKHVFPKCALTRQALSLTVLLCSCLLIQPALGAEWVCVQSSRELPSKVCTLGSTEHLLLWVAKQALTVMRWYQNWRIKCWKERGMDMDNSWMARRVVIPSLPSLTSSNSAKFLSQHEAVSWARLLTLHRAHT